MEGWVDLVDLIAPWPGVEPATFRSRVQRPTKWTNATTKTIKPVSRSVLKIFSFKNNTITSWPRSMQCLVFFRRYRYLSSGRYTFWQPGQQCTWFGSRLWSLDSWRHCSLLVMQSPITDLSKNSTSRDPRVYSDCICVQGYKSLKNSGRFSNFVAEIRKTAQARSHWPDFWGWGGELEWLYLYYPSFLLHT